MNFVHTFSIPLNFNRIRLGLAVFFAWAIPSQAVECLALTYLADKPEQLYLQSFLPDSLVRELPSSLVDVLESQIRAGGNRLRYGQIVDFARSQDSDGATKIGNALKQLELDAIRTERHQDFLSDPEVYRLSACEGKACEETPVRAADIDFQGDGPKGFDFVWGDKNGYDDQDIRVVALLDGTREVLGKKTSGNWLGKHYCLGKNCDRIFTLYRDPEVATYIQPLNKLKPELEKIGIRFVEVLNNPTDPYLIRRGIPDGVRWDPEKPDEKSFDETHFTELAKIYKTLKAHRLGFSPHELIWDPRRKTFFFDEPLLKDDMNTEHVLDYHWPVRTSETNAFLTALEKQPPVPPDMKVVNTAKKAGNPSTNYDHAESLRDLYEREFRNAQRAGYQIMTIGTKTGHVRGMPIEVRPTEVIMETGDGPTLIRFQDIDNEDPWVKLEPVFSKTPLEADRQKLHAVLQSIDTRHLIQLGNKLGYVDRVWLTAEGRPRVDFINTDGMKETIPLSGVNDISIKGPILGNMRTEEVFDLGKVAEQAGFTHLVHQTSADPASIMGFGAIHTTDRVGSLGAYFLASTGNIFRKTGFPWGKNTLLLDLSALNGARYQVGMDVRAHGAFDETGIRGYDRQGIAKLLTENDYLPDGKFYTPISSQFVRHILVDTEKVDDLRERLKRLEISPPKGMSWQEFVLPYQE